MANEERTSAELHDAIHQVLAEVDRRLACGELDGSGRYYTDEEFAAGAASGRDKRPEKETESPA